LVAADHAVHDHAHVQGKIHLFVFKLISMKLALVPNAKSQLIPPLFVLSALAQVAKMAIIQKCV
jgi:hypothetical protein